MKGKTINNLISDIEMEVMLTRDYIGKDRLDDRVMQAMRDVPREQFVSLDQQSRAYDNGPLGIGYNQTISQPYIVALMTDLLQLEADNRVLEIGTGSGYQSAVLSRLCKQVYTIERIEPLAIEARQRLRQLHYDNIESRIGNGALGWPEQAPFDAIMVTAAAAGEAPPALEQQLKIGGRLVIPVGGQGWRQQLMLLIKNEDGLLQRRNILGVAFVPLIESE